jgi:hypothetical protein
MKTTITYDDKSVLRTHRVRQVFAFAIIYNLAAVTLCLTGHMTPSSPPSSCP